MDGSNTGLIFNSSKITILSLGWHMVYAGGQRTLTPCHISWFSLLTLSKLTSIRKMSGLNLDCNNTTLIFLITCSVRSEDYGVIS